MVSKGRFRKPLMLRDGNTEIEEGVEYNVRSSRVKVTSSEMPKPRSLKNTAVKKVSEENDLKKAPPKMVSFDVDATLAVTLHINDYSKTEKRNSWYSKADYVRMKKERQPTLKYLRMNEQNGAAQKDTKEHCIRGLETHTPIQALRKQTNRMLAWSAVLDKQKQHGIKDPEAISLKYQAISIQCVQVSMIIGMRDEAAAGNAPETMSRKAPRYRNNGGYGQRKRQKTPSLCRSSTIQLPKSSFPSFLLQ
mmetsp:Transcript_31906/g.48218  ORF Transcript_31906/g.48218 Transcript_31906/m.48218 type:complete len:249 (+) Transcript_31906:53-799(+)